MKIRNIILGIALTLECGACNDWLTVQPETVIVEEDMCTTDEGVKQLLSGMYYTMRTLYSPAYPLGGGDGLAEGLACTWNPSGERLIALANRDYTTTNSVRYLLNNTFRDLYNVIAMANDFVKAAEQNKGKLTESVYNIGMGEALAIRAYCHLDLIRLWGPMPSRVDAGKNYLPYVTVNDPNPYEYISFERYMTLLLEDLDRAEEFLLASDPVVTNTFESTDQANVEWRYRKSRINYYGVLGLQARARLWNGDTEGALSYARKVINAENEDGTTKVRLMTLKEDGQEYQPGSNIWLLGDPSAYAEHLCGIKCDDWNWEKGPWTGPTGVQKVLYIEGVSGSETAHRATEFRELFDNKTTDFRYSRVWQVSVIAGGVIVTANFQKYKGFYISSTNTCQMNFPLIRLSEMYLIVMEKAPLDEANAAWEKFSAAREVAYVPYTEADRQERVYKEWIREFLGEGQNFYTYKRLGKDRMYFNTQLITENQYVLPIPEKEFLNN
ncbi:MAG TPA: RagB/SusD family nutrient uptake outer membrane protein [Butyricimonas virosa]|uniref:RagB/SusD family nutrient uptake outer membrane protein n=1 Tax=Butyricimonas virosa TaxID=544645 RepID=A0A921KZM6_9BACT|nr:RagB/SusD family nutrient uptake outer membrane protein [Butyricimonas virosa]